MKKQIIKITILITIITALIAGNNANSVQAVNSTANTTNTSTSNSITSSSIAGTSNANLANLGTKKYDFTGFKPDETSYDITIPEDVTEVEVYAKTQDSNATYTVSGDKKLKIGDNKVTITVTAADGKTKKLYYINVRRLGDPSKNPEETVEETKTEENEQQGKKDQSDITRYSEPHTEVGWYIIGISLAIVTILLIIFIRIDDYVPEKKNKRKSKNNYEEDYEDDYEDDEQYDDEEPEHYENNYDNDPQATKVLNLDEIKNMRSRPNTKGKHF